MTGLKPSIYTIRVEKAGLSPIEYTGMTLGVGQTLDARLRVQAGRRPGRSDGRRPRRPLVELSSAKMGVNVDEREVQSLPVNGRQMSQLLLQAPGFDERRPGHLVGHPVQRPRGRAERDSL